MREDGSSVPLARGYATAPKLFSSLLDWEGVCANVASAAEPLACDFPQPKTQPEMMFKTAAVSGFLVDTFFFLSLVDFSLDLR